MRTRTNLIFDRAPSAKDGLMLLGCVTIDPRSPLDNFVPVSHKTQQHQDLTEAGGNEQSARELVGGVGEKETEVVEHPVASASSLCSNRSTEPSTTGPDAENRNDFEGSFSVERLEVPDQDTVPMGSVTNEGSTSEDGASEPYETPQQASESKLAASSSQGAPNTTKEPVQAKELIQIAQNDDHKEKRNEDDLEQEYGPGENSIEASSTNLLPERDYERASLRSLESTPHANFESADNSNKLHFRSKYLLDVVTDRGHIRATTMRSTEVTAMITKLLAFGFRRVSEQTYDLRSDRIRTYSLNNHQRFFTELRAAFEDDIENLLRTHKTDTAYMLVNLKTALSPTVEIAEKEERSGNASLRLPTDKIVSHGASPTSYGDVEGTGKRKMARQSAMDGVLEGERAFAAEYCKITRKASEFSLQRLVVKTDCGLKVESKRKRFGSQDVAFAARSTRGTSDDEDSEDDEEEIYEDIYIDNLD